VVCRKRHILPSAPGRTGYRLPTLIIPGKEDWLKRLANLRIHADVAIKNCQAHCAWRFPVGRLRYPCLCHRGAIGQSYRQFSPSADWVLASRCSHHKLRGRCYAFNMDPCETFVSMDEVCHVPKRKMVSVFDIFSIFALVSKS